MLDYAPLTPLAAAIDLSAADPYARVTDALVTMWLDDYNSRTPSLDVIGTSYGDFEYLFDIKFERLLAAWGVSRGKHTGARDASRMAGAPKGAGKRYHRGHAIAHTLGGLTDINLVPQLGRINIGDFRQLENAAVATPGALYFSYWKYGMFSRSQVPNGVDQGLIRPKLPPDIRAHRN